MSKTIFGRQRSNPKKCKRKVECKYHTWWKSLTKQQDAKKLDINEHISNCKLSKSKTPPNIFFFQKRLMITYTQCDQHI